MINSATTGHPSTSRTVGLATGIGAWGRRRPDLFSSWQLVDSTDTRLFSGNMMVEDRGRRSES
eukprot:scaffold286044_cov19-Prasinocladus_malaysianus.AAC.1